MQTVSLMRPVHPGQLGRELVEGLPPEALAPQGVVALFAPTQADRATAIDIVRNANITPAQLADDILNFIIEPLLGNVAGMYRTTLDPAVIQALLDELHAQRGAVMHALGIAAGEQKAITGENALALFGGIGTQLIQQGRNVSTTPQPANIAVPDAASTAEIARDLASRPNVPPYLKDLLEQAPSVLQQMYVAAQLQFSSVLYSPRIVQRVQGIITAGLGTEEQKRAHTELAIGHLAALRGGFKNTNLASMALLPPQLRTPQLNNPQVRQYMNQQLRPIAQEMLGKLEALRQKQQVSDTTAVNACRAVLAPWFKTAEMEQLEQEMRRFLGHKQLPPPPQRQEQQPQ